MYSGIFVLPWWGYLIVTLAMTHVTIAAVTIYLHRHSAHRSLELHPLISHFFRLWLWLTTGMQTKQWTAIHRKHHARCETADDPHSPQVLGLRTVLWGGADLYTNAALDGATMDRFGQGTPDDWIERKLYASHTVLGIATMMVIDFALFGFIGLTIWAVQMMWIPLFAAGIINGVGHYWGYRSFPADDASRNISPWGILIGGEELHNNHHAYPASARLSSKWWEFDIGWMYIRMMELAGLSTVKKLPPRITLHPAKTHCDYDTLQAVLACRYDVLANYARELKSACSHEFARLNVPTVRLDWPKVKSRLQNERPPLPASERKRMDEALGGSRTLSTVCSMNDELKALWQRSSATREQLLHQLEGWCQRAEASGIAALRDFSLRLRRYQLASA